MLGRNNEEDVSGQMKICGDFNENEILMILQYIRLIVAALTEEFIDVMSQKFAVIN